MTNANPDRDAQRERAARNQALFREVNERIDELNSQLNPGQPAGYLCECCNPQCAEVLTMDHEDYERIRRDPTEFVVLPGHEHRQLEEVVDETHRWVVIRKIGVGAAVAGGLAHRNGDR